MDYDALSDDEIRLAIARRVGYTNLKVRWSNLTGILRMRKNWGFMLVPNWTASVSEVWELEETIAPEYREAYCQALTRVVNRQTGDTLDNQRWALIHATPRQRCIAWLEASDTLERQDGSKGE